LWITVYCFLTKENKLPFAANRWKFAVSVFRLQQKMEVAVFCKFRFPHIFIETAAHLHIYGKLNYIYIRCHFKQKTEAQAIFLNLFTICASPKWKFVICPFVDEEINRSYLWTKQTKQTKWTNRLNRLAHLCKIEMEEKF
jgi:hypothetical protein